VGRAVLIVEDEQELAKVLKRYLEDLAYTVQLAFAGDTDLKIAESKPFDLILLDIMLPGMDGLDVCRHLRAHRVYTPVLILTARASEVDKDGCAKLTLTGRRRGTRSRRQFAPPLRFIPMPKESGSN
jgi:DNA-binding response OmpR family regulator